MAEDPTSGCGNAGDEQAEESHEALWTSMSTVIVTDKTPARARQCTVEDSSDSDSESPVARARPAGRAAARERRRAEQASDSDGSTSDSGGSSPCRVVDVEKESSGAKEGVTLADLLGAPCPDVDELSPLQSMAAQASMGSKEVLGGDEDALRLPSVERAQKQLDEIISRRHMISAISSKYSPAAPVGRSKDKGDAVPLGPARYPPPPPPLPEGAEAKLSEDSEDPPLGHEDVPVAKPPVSERPQAAEEKPKPGRPLPDSGETRPVRISGPAARPDQAQISDVLRQLSAGLSGLGTRPKAAWSLGGGDVSKVASTPAASSKSSAPEPSPLQVGSATSLTGTGPAKPSSSVDDSADGFTSIVDVDKRGPTGARAAWGAQDPASSSTAGASSAPVSSTASRYLASDEGAGGEANDENLLTRSARSSEGGAHAWPVDTEKFKAGRKLEESRREELWHQFLAGNDHPVGGDFLPSPDSYHGCGPM